MALVAIKPLQRQQLVTSSITWDQALLRQKMPGWLAARKGGGVRTLQPCSSYRTLTLGKPFRGPCRNSWHPAASGPADLRDCWGTKLLSLLGVSSENPMCPSKGSGAATNPRFSVHSDQEGVWAVLRQRFLP